MSETHHPNPRVLVAAVTQGRNQGIEAVAKSAGELVQKGRSTLVRTVVVKGERQYIRQLVSNVANDNEADAILMIGGCGIGPSDDACEAIDGFVERRMEGFGESFRRLLEVELGAAAMLARATAGVYNQCVVFAMNGRSSEILRAVESLILPTLADVVDLATGRKRAGEGASKH